MTDNISNTVTNKSVTMSWSKRIAYVFLGALSLIVMILGIALSPLGVSLLVNSANNQNGIHIDKVEGSFYTQLNISRLRFDNKSVRLDAKNLEVDLSLSCLFSMQVCLPSLGVENIQVDLAFNESTSDGEVLSQYIELPIEVLAPNIHIESFSLNQTNAQNLLVPLVNIDSLTAGVQAHKVVVLKHLNVNGINVYLPASTPVADAPVQHWLDQLWAFSYEAIDIPDVFVPVNAHINKAKITELCVHQAQLDSDAKTAFCARDNLIQGKINKQILQLDVSTQLPNLPFKSVALKGSVNLAKQFAHDVLVNLTPNMNITSSYAKPIELSVKGTMHSTAARVRSNQVAHIIAQLDVDIQQADLPINADIQLLSVQTILSAWMPQLTQPINSAKLNVSGNTAAYEIVASAKIENTNASLIDFSGKASLLDKQLLINKLSSSGDIGLFQVKSAHDLQKINGQVALLNTLDVVFDDFNVAPLLASEQTSEAPVAVIESALFGKLSANGQYTQDSLSGGITCKNISGKVQSYDLSLLCDMTLSEKGLLQVKSLRLSQGQNAVVGKGLIQLPLKVSVASMAENLANISQTSSDFSLQITAPNLTAFYPGLSGGVNGDINIDGTIDTATMQANLQADSIKFDTLTLRQANININTALNGDWPTSLSISLNELAQQELLADSVNIDLRGNLKQHNIELNLQHPQYAIMHSFSGSSVISDTDITWNGKWDLGKWRLPFDTFTLAQPTTIDINNGNVVVNEHCWSAQTSTQNLCINSLSYVNKLAQLDALLNYNMSVPLLHFFPNIIQPGTNMPMQSDISLSFNEKNGVELDAYNLITQSTLVTSKHSIDLSAVVANLRLHDQVLHTNVFAGTSQTGAIGLRSELNLLPDNRTHTGELRIEQFDIAPLLRFVPGAEKLAGLIHGAVSFDGALSTPALNGRLNIDNGELILDNYPYPFSNFNQSINIVNNEAIIEGEFELGAGDAQYNAKAVLDEVFSISGQVRGSGMQIAYQNSELLASPNISFDVSPNKIKLNGEIAIPNAQFEIKELPKSAKAPSSDTIIVGKPVEPPLIPIGLDIDLRLMIDVPKLGRVNIDALDLEASLAGDLRLRLLQKNNIQEQTFSPLETYLTGNINVLSGNYEAYGQKLQIRSGEIYFNGPPSLPQFDISAIRNPLNTEDQVVAGIRISGNPVIPKVELFSEPAMIQARQLSYLLQGTDLDGGPGTAYSTQLVNTLVGFGVGSSENRVNKLGKSLGFDSLNIQTAGQGLNTQVQVTGRISDNIQVTYGVGLFDSASQVILKYKLLPKLYIEAVASAESTVDLFYEMTRTEK